MASTPLFLWDHVAAVVFWVALYGVEVALILSVYARYPDSEQAVSHCGVCSVKRASFVLALAALLSLGGKGCTPSCSKFQLNLRLLYALCVLRAVPEPTDTLLHLFCTVQAWHLRHMVTLSKRMLPARLGVFKRAIYALATGFKPTAAIAAAPASTAATATTVAKDVAASAATPMAFVDTPVADVVADIEASSRAPLGLPVLPSPPQTDKQGQQEQRGPSRRAKARKGLAERRSKKGLAPGQWDPAALGAVDKRSKELLERKSYLKNFWYAVGKCLLPCVNVSLTVT